jgi:hypothetical protein
MTVPALADDAPVCDIVFDTWDPYVAVEFAAEPCLRHEASEFSNVTYIGNVAFAEVAAGDGTELQLYRRGEEGWELYPFSIAPDLYELDIFEQERAFEEGVGSVSEPAVVFPSSVPAPVDAPEFSADLAAPTDANSRADLVAEIFGTVEFAPNGQEDLARERIDEVTAPAPRFGASTAVIPESEFSTDFARASNVESRSDLVALLIGEQVFAPNGAEDLAREAAGTEIALAPRIAPAAADIAIGEWSTDLARASNVNTQAELTEQIFGSHRFVLTGSEDLAREGK